MTEHDKQLERIYTETPPKTDEEILDKVEEEYDIKQELSDDAQDKSQE